VLGAHCLPQRNCRGLLVVRVDKLLGYWERAELAVPSEDFVILGMKKLYLWEGGARMYRRELKMRWHGRGGQGRDGQVGAKGHGVSGGHRI
jgi:hypothetical protein